VIRVSEVLESRCSKPSLARRNKPLALRIIHALSVHRLTTGGDIHIPIGPTAENCATVCCLYQPGIEEMGANRRQTALAGAGPCCGKS